MPASIHDHPEEWLAADLVGSLSEEERRALGEHLAGCEHCRELQGDFVLLDESLLREFPAAVGPAADFDARLLRSFRNGRSGGLAERLRALAVWFVRQRGVRATGVVAALLTLIGIGSLVTGGHSGKVEEMKSFAAMSSSGEMPSDSDGVTQVTASDDEGSERVPEIHGNPTQSEFGDRRFGFSERGDVLERSAGRSTDFSNASSDDVNGAFSTRRGIALADGSPPLASTGTSLSGEAASDSSRLSLGHLTGSLASGNAFTGDTNVSAGTLVASAGPVTGTTSGSKVKDAAQGLPSLKLLNGRRVSDSEHPGDSSVGDGSSTITLTLTNGTEAPAATNPDVRKLIRNARAELEVAAFDAAVDAITAAATGNGGFLDTGNSTRGGNGKVSGTVVVKLLPESLDRFLATLRTLGEVKNQTIRTEDVTKDYFDTDARLRNARRMEDRLLKMLEEVKGKMSEVLQVEKELGRVRADIETMQGQLKLYDAQVRYATVTLDVREKDLGQPVSYLLNETATLSLLAGDVERAAAEARRVAVAAHAQVVRADLSRDASGHTRATLRLLIAPEAAAEVIAQVKALGRVENFHLQDERTAQNGNSADAKGTDSARVDRGTVTFDITISHDEQISRQVSFTLVAAQVENVFEKARAAAVSAGGEIVNSGVSRTQNGHASATLGIRVPPAGEAALLASLKGLGRALNVETRRVDAGSQTTGGPVLISLNIADQEPAVQQTVVQVQTNDVERGADEIKRQAAADHVSVEVSNFSSQSGGRQRGVLKFRLPMRNYAGFIERVRALGTVKAFSVEREEQPETAPDGSDASAPAVIELTLYNEGSIVGADAGLGSTLRRTFGQGAGALTWSIRMIGVAVAFLAPWVVLLLVATVVVRWQRRAAARRSQKVP